MQPQFTIDVMGSKKTESLLLKLADDMGVSIKFLCEDQARLWIIDLIKRIGNDPGLSLPKQLRAAETRVAQDINRVFQSTESFLGDQNQSQAFNLTLPHSGQSMESFHNSVRTKKGGVSLKGKTRKVATMEAIAVFRIKQQNKIFQAKSGFVKPLKKFISATAGSDGRVLAKSVTRHMGKVPDGRTIDGMTRFGDGTIRATNEVSYANDLVSTSDKAYLESKRQKDLLSNASKRKEKTVAQYQKLMSEVG